MTFAPIATLPTPAIIVLGLLKKKEGRKINNFAWVVKMLFRIPGTSQMCFSSFKGFYQCEYYCKECL